MNQSSLKFVARKLFGSRAAPVAVKLKKKGGGRASNEAEKTLQTLRRARSPVFDVEKLARMNCSICGSSDLDVLRYPVYKSSLFAGLLLASCRCCGLGWVPIEDFDYTLDSFYRDEYADAFFSERTSKLAYYSQKNPVWTKEIHRPRDRARKHAQDVARFGPLRRVLDIGAGVGLFLHAVEADEKYAVELDQHAVRILEHELGVTVQSSRAEREEFFDLVMASHSLEHFTYNSIPTVLNDVKCALRAGGIFYIEVPSGAEQLSEFSAGKRRNQRMEPHTLFFSSASLLRLLLSSGFEILETQLCSWTRMHVPQDELESLVGDAKVHNSDRKNLVMIARKPA